MGAISPVPFADDVFMQKIEERIVKPTIEGLKKDNLPYKGFIFIGLIKVDNEPMVIEYNVRMGDPETEVVLPRIKSDILELFQAVGEEKLAEKTLVLDSRYATTVMMVSGGYPQAYEKGKNITGIEDVKDSIVFHAGTKIVESEIHTNGGRVIALTSLREKMNEALLSSFANADKIKFEGKYYRTDIGFDMWHQNLNKQLFTAFWDSNLMPYYFIIFFLATEILPQKYSAPAPTIAKIKFGKFPAEARIWNEASNKSPIA